MLFLQKLFQIDRCDFPKNIDLTIIISVSSERGKHLVETQDVIKLHIKSLINMYDNAFHASFLSVANSF